MHPWGLGEILVIVLIVLIFWGPKRIGGLGKGLGEGIRNFREGMQHGSRPPEADRRNGELPPPPPPADPPRQT